MYEYIYIMNTKFNNMHIMPYNSRKFLYNITSFKIILHFLLN